ncbi:glutaredoxin family protein [Pseudonocardiaceae bacterium YIM PH 21723]|nr:glutaredoxin family protein [Pseudonocardiaceae bacterium YIM PH 21723]
MAEVTLLVRAGCHSCAEARTDVERVCGELDVPWTEVDVDTDPELQAEYGDMVPVFLIDGAMHGYWKLEEPRFRAALSG